MKKLLRAILFLVAMAVVFAGLVDFSLWLDDIQNHRWKAVVIRLAVWTIVPPIIYAVVSSIGCRRKKPHS